MIMLDIAAGYRIGQ